jgi:hypothetical protein
LKKASKKPPRRYTLGEVFQEIGRYVKDVSEGADPIEALHGHVCGRGCWHWAHLSDDEIAKREAANAKRR